MKLFVLILVLIGGYASAHQFTPTYPKLTASHMSGVSKAEMLLFNTRKEIEYYSLGVFDKDWNKIKFASENKIIPIAYQERKYVNVYIRDEDTLRTMYICSRSKILQSVKSPSIVASRICSKIKK